MGGKLDTNGGCGRNTHGGQTCRDGGSWVWHHDQVGDIDVEESHSLLLHYELDVVMLDVGHLQNSLEPSEGSGAVQLVGLLVVDEKLSRDLFDLLVGIS